MKELMVHVERAVRAVHASRARKRRMRQELLAHLTNLVEEEKARGGGEQEALARARQRFGAWRAARGMTPGRAECPENAAPY
jgi:hypothetical protein